MIRRPGLTLLEVLVSIFIMGIGMLALLTLFPLGALNMAQALQQDRAASAASLAHESALARDLRRDAGLPVPVQARTTAQMFNRPFPVAAYPALPNINHWPSWPVYVDGYGLQAGAQVLGSFPGVPGVLPASPGIGRTGLSYASTPAGVARWFSLPDDIGFDPNGQPRQPGGFVERGGRYTWAYLMRRPRASSTGVVEVTVVVYAGRDVDQPTAGELVYGIAGAKGSNTVTLTYGTAPLPAEKPTFKRGSWILDVTYNGTRRVVQGVFYRVVSAEDAGANQITLELESPLEDAMTAGVVMANVVEVYKKGTSWHP